MNPKTIKQKYGATFHRELARLNAAQRQAVERIEGPVLVIAGPGTGKTFTVHTIVKLWKAMGKKILYQLLKVAGDLI